MLRFLLLIILLIFPTLAQAQTCEDAYLAKMGNFTDEWLESLDKASHQRETSSNLLDYNLADFRTYTCKLNLLCEEVKLSSFNNPPPDQTLNLLGCQEKPVELLPGCENPENLEKATNWGNKCTETAKLKIETGQTFLKSMIHRDAYHKKTAFLVYRYELILRKIHTLLFEHLRIMEGFLSEFVNRARCYISDCSLK